MTKTRQSGFTIYELLVVAPVFMLVIAGLISFLVGIYGQLLIKDSQVTMALEAQSAFNSIQDDLFFARNFAESPNASMVDVHQPTGGWAFNTAPSTLIVYQIALDKAYQASDRQVVYQGAAPCDQNQPPVLTNLIYYIDAQDRLRRRVLVPDPVHERCVEPFLKQTCPFDTTRTQQELGGGTTEVVCNQDVTLAQGVSEFTIQYYDGEGTLIDTAAGGSPLQAERITLNLTLQRTALAQTISYDSELSIKKINRGDPNIQ